MRSRQALTEGGATAAGAAGAPTLHSSHSLPALRSPTGTARSTASGGRPRHCHVKADIVVVAARSAPSMPHCVSAPTPGTSLGNVTLAVACATHAQRTTSLMHGGTSTAAGFRALGGGRITCTGVVGRTGWSVVAENTSRLPRRYVVVGWRVRRQPKCYETTNGTVLLLLLLSPGGGSWGLWQSQCWMRTPLQRAATRMAAQW